MLSLFKKYSLQYDEINDKRERLVKKSRDVTSGSKKLIFLLHRYWESDISVILRESKEPLKKIREDIGLIQSEFKSQEYGQLKFDSSISPGLQEYIEAVSFLHYLEFGDLISLQKVEDDLCSALNLTEPSQRIVITIKDYLQGIADLSGELMRLNVNAATRRRSEMCYKIRSFLHELSDYFAMLPPDITSFLSNKIQVMQTSVTKVDKVCFTLVVRKSEFPDDAPFEVDLGDEES